MVKNRACYQDHMVLTQLMAGLRSLEWRTRVFQREGETVLKSTVTFLDKSELGVKHSTNGEQAGAGAVSALGTKPKSKQPHRLGKSPGARATIYIDDAILTLSEV